MSRAQRQREGGRPRPRPSALRVPKCAVCFCPALSGAACAIVVLDERMRGGREGGGGRESRGAGAGESGGGSRGAGAGRGRVTAGVS